MGFRTSGIWGTIRLEVRHEPDHQDNRVHTSSPDSRRCCLPSMRVFRAVSSHSSCSCLCTDSKKREWPNGVICACPGVALRGLLHRRERMVSEPLRAGGCFSAWKHVLCLQGRWESDRRIHRAAALIDKPAQRTTQSQADSLGVDHSMKQRSPRSVSSLCTPAVVLMVLAVLVGTPRLLAQDGGSSLTIRIVGAKSSKGRIAIAVFNGEAGFPGDKSKTVRTLQAGIDPQTLIAQVTLKNLPRGVYAVSVFHDENMNGRLDKNVLGIPKEGYGASNNPRKSMGPPKFAEAKFQLDQPENVLEIKLLY